MTQRQYDSINSFEYRADKVQAKLNAQNRAQQIAKQTAEFCNRTEAEREQELREFHYGKMAMRFPHKF